MKEELQKLEKKLKRLYNRNFPNPVNWSEVEETRREIEETEEEIEEIKQMKFHCAKKEDIDNLEKYCGREQK